MGLVWGGVMAKELSAPARGQGGVFFQDGSIVAMEPFVTVLIGNVPQRAIADTTTRVSSPPATETKPVCEYGYLVRAWLVSQTSRCRDIHRDVTLGEAIERLSAVWVPAC